MMLLLSSDVRKQRVLARFRNRESRILRLPAESAIMMVVDPARRTALEKIDHVGDGVGGVHRNVKMHMVGHAAGDQKFGADVFADARQVAVKVVTPFRVDERFATGGGPDEMDADVEEGGHGFLPLGV